MCSSLTCDIFHVKQMSGTTAKRVTRSSASRATNYDNVKENNRPEHPNTPQRTVLSDATKPVERPSTAEPVATISSSQNKENTEVRNLPTVWSFLLTTIRTSANIHHKSKTLYHTLSAKV
jgi:hypothetical protein